MCTDSSPATERPSASGARENGLLSVIVPVYGVAPYLEQCVRSILSQTYAPLEVLLIDDGSTDGGGELADALASKDARMTVLHQENRGQAAAKNRGIEKARGAYLAFVDGDDWLDPDMYASLIGAMEESGVNVSACAFDYVFPDRTVHTGGDTGERRVFSAAEALVNMAREREVRIESAPKVYARQAIGNARFPEGTLYEEVGFARAMLRNITGVAYVDRPYYRYRQQRAGSTNGSFPVAKLAVLDECDAFVQDLRTCGFSEAAAAMESFTLDHLMRMFCNAKACRAERKILSRLKHEYRARYQAGKSNPYVRKLRGLLFSISPDAYCLLSGRIHGRKAA